MEMHDHHLLLKQAKKGGEGERTGGCSSTAVDYSYSRWHAVREKKKKKKKIPDERQRWYKGHFRPQSRFTKNVQRTQREHCVLYRRTGKKKGGRRVLSCSMQVQYLIRSCSPCPFLCSPVTVAPVPEKADTLRWTKGACAVYEELHR